MPSLRDVPLLRLAIDFVIGIMASDIFTRTTGIDLRVICLILMASTLLLAFFFFGRRHTRLTSSFLLLACFFAGAESCSIKWSDVSIKWSDTPIDYKAEILSGPEQRQHSTRYKMSIATHPIYAYLSEEMNIYPGDSITIKHASIHQPENFSKDLDFDYALFLHHHGITGTVFLQSTQIAPSDNTKHISTLGRLRTQLAQVYTEQEKWNENEKAILRALTLGDRSTLKDEIRDVYSEAGISHILALSGLHVGIIYMLFSCCLHPFFRSRKSRWIQEAIILTFLWLFAFLTGASPSILRAVTMCTIYAVANLVSSDRSSISALSLAALVLLIVNPFTLFDVGFQLSFLSMLSIILFSDSFTPSMHKPFTSIGNALGMTLAAQVGTAPLVIHYFGQFPVYFIITNLLIIPLIYLTMLLAAFWGLSSLFTHFVTNDIALNFIGRAINGINEVSSRLLGISVKGMNGLASWVASLPGSSVSVNHFTWVQVVAAYGAIAAFMLFLRKKPSAFVAFLACMALLLLFRLLDV